MLQYYVGQSHCKVSWLRQSITIFITRLHPQSGDGVPQMLIFQWNSPKITTTFRLNWIIKKTLEKQIFSFIRIVELLADKAIPYRTWWRCRGNLMGPSFYTCIRLQRITAVQNEGKIQKGSRLGENVISINWEKDPEYNTNLFFARNKEKFTQNNFIST